VGGRISIWRDEEDAWADRAMEGPLAASRAAASARAHRFRYGRFWAAETCSDFRFDFDRHPAVARRCAKTS